MMAAPVTGSVHKAEFEEKPEEQPQKVDSETTSLLEPNPWDSIIAAEAAKVCIFSFNSNLRRAHILILIA